jgi:hypothetical protein
MKCIKFCIQEREDKNVEERMTCKYFLKKYSASVCLDSGSDWGPVADFYEHDHVCGCIDS